LIELGSFKKTDELLEFKSTIDLNIVNRKRTLLQLNPEFFHEGTIYKCSVFNIT